MSVGAVIVAAGMSSRMGDFKPMLSIGSISIAQRIVATLHQSGISKIVVVTGFKAQMLEKHLANLGLVFLRNENYETTHMFDSAKIGLEYMRDKCDRVLFTPVDIPLFTASSVTALLESSAPIACPVCDGKKGHPIMISSSLLYGILSYSGEGGLRGAMSACGTPIVEIPVDDQGILHDADTPEDYLALLDYHNSQLLRPQVSVSLAREKTFFDDKTVMLLSLVEETGSVRAACQRMQISYSTGWNIIRGIESQVSRPLIERMQGGKGGGKSRLTDSGKTLIKLFADYEEAVRASAGALYDEYFADFLGKR